MSTFSLWVHFLCSLHPAFCLSPTCSHYLRYQWGVLPILSFLHTCTVRYSVSWGPVLISFVFTFFWASLAMLELQSIILKIVYRILGIIFQVPLYFFFWSISMHAYNILLTVSCEVIQGFYLNCFLFFKFKMFDISVSVLNDLFLCNLQSAIKLIQCPVIVFQDIVLSLLQFPFGSFHSSCVSDAFPCLCMTLRLFKFSCTFNN